MFLKTNKKFLFILPVLIFLIGFLFLPNQAVRADTCGDNYGPYGDGVERDFDEYLCEEYNPLQIGWMVSYPGTNSGDSPSGCWFDMCCGDDTDEYPVLQQCNTAAACTSNETYSCCDQSDDCMWGGDCYSMGTELDLDSDGNVEVCIDQVWMDCNYNNSQCPSGYYCSTNTCVACECASGDCCDGCRYRPSSYQPAGTCRKCTGTSATSVLQTSSEDLWNQCATGADGSATSCQSNNCSGTSAACGYLSSATTCRTSKGVCDIAETCSGSAYTCPTDAFQPNTYVCGYSAYNGCVGACTKKRDVYKCTGSSADCPTTDQGDNTAAVTNGKVCSAGSEINATTSVYCTIINSCTVGSCSGYKYYVSCDSEGAGGCDNSFVYSVVSQVVYASSGYSLNADCTTNGTTQCSATDHCSGNTRYDGYMCNGSGTCNLNYSDIGCCAHDKCTNTTHPFCQYYNVGDENRKTSPTDDNLTQSNPIQLAAQYYCAPAKYLNRGTEAVSWDLGSLNTYYSRTQTYTSDADWWQFAGDGMVTAETSVTSSNTDLCFVYNYDPCTLSSNSDVVVRNPSGTRYDLGDIKQGLPITSGCSSNWIWIDLSSYLGSTSGPLSIALFSGDSDYIREWQFGWKKSEAGNVTDGTNSTWCCDQSTDCVDDAPAQGNRVSGDPDSTSSGCYNTGSTRDVNGDGNLDVCSSGNWLDCTDNSHCSNNYACNTSTNTCYTDCLNDDNRCASGYYCSADICVAKKANGVSCSANNQCVSGNCRKEIDSSGYYCAAAGKLCSENSSGHAGYAAGEVGTNSNASWLCSATDVSYQCSSTTKCATYNSKYCNGAGTWNSGTGAGVPITGCNAYSCSGQVVKQDACNGTGSCGSQYLTIATCGGGENSRCVSGACQNLCTDTTDNDGDGYIDGQDSDCGGCSQCTVGACCNTTTGCYLSSDILCRASAGVCDVAESCTGSSATCPTDAFRSTSYNPGGTCQKCTGTSAAPVLQTSSEDLWNQCATGADGSDTSCQSNNCSGTSAACGYLGSATTCRTSKGVCDSVEFCSGSAYTCPTDEFQEPRTICRSASGACDITESCGGSFSTIDTLNNVGLYPDIVIGTDGKPMISYYDYTNGNLKVCHCSDAWCSWANCVIADYNGDVGKHPSIAIGIDSKPIISYYDVSNGDLKICLCSDVYCLSADCHTIDSIGDVGQFSSIAIPSGGTPVISYFDNTNKKLKVGKCADTNCSSFNSYFPDSTGNQHGLFTSIAIGSDGLPRIAYQNSTQQSLRFIKCSAADCSTGGSALDVDYSIDGDAYGYNISLALDSNNLPVISHYDMTNGKLRVCKCSTSDCSSKTCTPIDDIGVSGSLYTTSIAIGSDGLPIISYYEYINHRLKTCKCSNSSCTAASCGVVDNIGDVGEYSSLAIGSDGLPIIAYYDETNGDLKTLKCATASCSSTAVCPTDKIKSLGSVCRASTGICDKLEACDGISANCPDESYQPNNLVCGLCKYCQNGSCVNVSTSYTSDLDPNNQCSEINCYSGFCGDNTGECYYYEDNQQHSCALGYRCVPDCKGKCIADPTINTMTFLQGSVVKSKPVYYNDDVYFSNPTYLSSNVYGSQNGDLFINSDVTLDNGAYLIWGENHTVHFNLNGKIIFSNSASSIKIDWEGKPFNWSSGKYYSSDRTEASGLITCGYGYCNNSMYTVVGTTWHAMLCDCVVFSWIEGDTGKPVYGSGLGGALVQANNLIRSGPKDGKYACICVKDNPSAYTTYEDGLGIIADSSVECSAPNFSCPSGYHLITDADDNCPLWSGTQDSHQKTDWLGTAFNWAYNTLYGSDHQINPSCGSESSPALAYAITTNNSEFWTYYSCPVYFPDPKNEWVYDWIPIGTGSAVTVTKGKGWCKTCMPDCTGKSCGPDGCGGVCGMCAYSYYCSSAGQCVYYNYLVGGSCFIADSLVALYDGTYKKIQNLEPGDEIWGWDFNLNKKVLSKVEKLIVHNDKRYRLYRLAFSSGKVIYPTPEHRIYTLNKNWIAVRDLEVGDQIMDINQNNNQAIVIDIKKDYQLEDIVYNLQTSTRNYFVSGVLVHNLKAIADDYSKF